MRASMRLSEAPTFPEQFVAAGAMPPLLQLLRSESAAMQEKAVVLLALLTDTESPVVLAAINTLSVRSLLARLQRSPRSEAMEQAYATIMEVLAEVSVPSSEAAAATAARFAPAAAAASAALVAIATAPIVAASQQLPPRPRKSCWSCGATGVPLKKCSVCAVAAYCGAGCQKADWKAHKGQCAGLKVDANSAPAAGISSLQLN